MRKIVVLIVLLVVFSSLVSALSFADLLSGNALNFITGDVVKNKGPVNTLNAPVNNQVVTGKKVKFDWAYSDANGDEQQQYNLQIDNDYDFYTPFNYYGLTETVKLIYIPTGDGKYHWRVRSYDGNDWGKWSGSESFYLDESEKVCSDGTGFWKCSSDKPLYCDGGRLVENCKKCGCPANQDCLESGVCLVQTCSDGTLYGDCSDTKPKYCRNGVLADACNFCGCAQGSECVSSGECVVSISQKGYGLESKKSLLMRIADFFKSLLRI